MGEIVATLWSGSWDLEIFFAGVIGVIVPWECYRKGKYFGERTTAHQLLLVLVRRKRVVGPAFPEEVYIMAVCIAAKNSPFVVKIDKASRSVIRTFLYATENYYYT